MLLLAAAGPEVSDLRPLSRGAAVKALVRWAARLKCFTKSRTWAMHALARIPVVKLQRSGAIGSRLGQLLLGVLPHCLAMSARIGHRVIIPIDRLRIRIISALFGAKPFTPPGGRAWHCFT
jgi:hypothetical protein